MTEKDFKKLTRRQLLELLLVQTQRADSLEAELELTKSKLQSKLLSEKESGSIAEAALKLNGIFEAADSAAAQYLENIRVSVEYQEKLKSEAEEEARRIIANAEAQANETLLEAQKMLEDTKRRCAGITRKMRKK
jgi:vacuolar-type H+-ATPase subunit H